MERKIGAGRRLLPGNRGRRHRRLRLVNHKMSGLPELTDHRPCSISYSRVEPNLPLG